MRPGPEALLIVGAAAAAGAAVLRLLVRRRRQPADNAEAQRRIRVTREGRMIDGFISETSGATVYYSYMVRGVEYTAAQDLSGLPGCPAEGAEALVGPVTVRFLPDNPSNSVILSEEWSGIRSGGPVRRPAGGKLPLAKGA